MRFLLLSFICCSLNLFSQIKTDSIELASKIDSINNTIFDAHILSRNYEYEKAIQQTISSIEKAIEINNDSLTAKGYTSLGVIYTNLGKFDLAIREQRKALKYSKTPKSSRRVMAWVYNNIGYAFYENLHQTDSAIYYFKKNIAVYKSLNNTIDIGLSYYNLGEMYEYSDKLDLALKTLDSAIYFSKKAKDDYSLSFSHQELSKVYIKLNDTINSLKHIDIALKTAEKDKYNDILFRLYKLKYEIYKSKKNRKEALYNLEKYLELRELIYKSNLSKITQEVAAKYELKQTEKLLDKAVSESKKKEKVLKLSKTFLFLLIVLFFISVLLAYFYYKNNNLKKENNKLLVSKNERLRELQYQTELNFLKTQIQPHFFFNTLNNLYALIIEKSGKAENVVIKLSELMQYAIYDTKKTTVSVLHEINNIQNYLELEALRHHNLNIPPINIEGNISNIKIPPLLFTTFIENSFKHGNLDNKEFLFNITIKEIDSENLLFTVKNSFEKKMNTTKKKGIGLQNIKRRLTLIYKNDYKLIINTKDNIFSVYLKIPIQK